MGTDLAGWLAVLLRFTHVVAAIMWIGNSLLFTWMELNLLPPKRSTDKDLLGTLDMLHGGGVFHLQKKVLHPDNIPTPLHWFMWQSYTTWITGFVLLLTLFHTGSGAFLLDPTKSSMPGYLAIIASLAGLLGGWLVYDGIWRSPLKKQPALAIAISLGLLIFVAALYNQAFNGRAVYLQIGAMMGTMMSANVFFHIIANQRKFMAALRAGKEHELSLGKAAKQRSLQNHYMTFPVIFLMLSAHFPQLYSAEWNVAILAVLIVSLILIKYLMNSRYYFKEWLHAIYGAVFTAVCMIFLLLSLPSIYAKNSVTTTAQREVMEGRKVFTSQGCGACHMEGSSDLAPNLHGIFGKTVVLTDQSETIVDAAYLRESIVDPQSRIVQGYTPSMPSFSTLSEEEIQALIAYIQSTSAPPRP